MTDTHDKKKPDTATLLKSDLAVALKAMGLESEAIRSLPRPLLNYLTELHHEFVKAESSLKDLKGEVDTAHSDMIRLRRQRDALRAALANVDGVADPIDGTEYSQPVLSTITETAQLRNPSKRKFRG